MRSRDPYRSSHQLPTYSALRWYWVEHAAWDVIDSQRDPIPESGSTGGRRAAGTMFEKSLYDLIKGLRNHKGGEDEYVQDCLRECKAEIKSQDMDKKATALLKLIYLEMFGYDMSWASFHVLEVMSSSKYLQKRVGYLGAVQSFRPDTEVLMLATNMLKKDIVSPSIPSLSLPLVTLPHIITPSLAMSLLPDILSRLSHSNAVVRKKTIVCLYRLALVYPEALKLAWPKIKDRLMDDQEDSSVTTAAINVVCELGWRRPHDFLPLAPRFFELLVDSGNNWMAIKIIKLFATLTPLEPRLTRKLLRPLMNIIETTTAMSLLYECINGIIQGGILDGEDNLQERDDVATLCVGKLRGMIVMDSDPNLKYVALLALNRIVTTHPMLVSMQQDVIMDCLDDADISIRLQALELAAGMVASDTLQPVVNRLLDQLRLATLSSPISGSEPEVFPSAQFETEDTEGRKTSGSSTIALVVLPNDYRGEVVHRILDICSQNNYSEVVDFEWYLGTLVQLVRLLPPSETEEHWIQSSSTQEATLHSKTSVAFRIGSEIRNVAVRVKGVRLEATRAAESLILIDNRSTFFPAGCNVGNDVLGPISWVVGEYADDLLSPGQTLQSLIDLSNVSLPAKTLQLFLQAIPKVFVRVYRSNGLGDSWSSETSLLLARVVGFLEALAAHPDLDVQERAIEFLELLRLSAEALHPDTREMPFLLASVLPGLFMGLELNPVATSAQKKVVLPPTLHLDVAFNEDLLGLFHTLDNSHFDGSQYDALQDFYYYPGLDPPPPSKPFPSLAPIEMPFESSYQNILTDSSDPPGATERRKVERRERYKDDPFYIAPLESSSGALMSPLLNPASGDALDVDSIPIVDLKLEDGQSGRLEQDASGVRRGRSKKMEVTADETFGIEETPPHDSLACLPGGPTGSKRSLLQVDSSGLGREAVLAEDDGEVEMRKAMQNVEQMRLRMQRASERIQLQGTPAEGTLVKKKGKKKHTPVPPQAVGLAAGDYLQPAETKKRKKKQKKQKQQKEDSVELSGEQ
ncbi:AP-3 complex subunit delta [Penicillium canariense]|uniref:AP-3 complex subunit delta n=1 Tax=Penicillium canariense TaxID=189055 RepID=A0A9W9LHQ5_9EURO|nr:AP-3 complex subunit delta [Penicillium canariense]KAJ5157571.1 AP-3 complex subunit delta [Penicillium canariense]